MLIDDKIEIINDIREKDKLKKSVSKQVLNKYPLGGKREEYIYTRYGKSHVYFYYPLNNKGIYPVFVNLHGGGFVKNHSDMDELFCRKIVNNVGCVVADIDYKTAPEYVFPYALYECYDDIKWIHQNSSKFNIYSDKIAVGGHSAGANISAGITLLANELKEFTLCCQVLDYPVLDLYTDPLAKKGEAKALSAEKEKFYTDMYIKSCDKKNPFASPVFYPEYKLKGMPLSVILTAEFDNFGAETKKYASMLVKNGNEVMMKCFLGSSHGFTIDCREDFKGAQEMIFKALKLSFYD